MIHVLKEIRQEEKALWLPGHLSVLCYLFQGPMCGFGLNISKIFSAREWSFPDATCRHMETRRNAFFLLLLTFNFLKDYPPVWLPNIPVFSFQHGWVVPIYSLADSFLSYQDGMRMGWEPPTPKTVLVFLSRRSHTNRRSDQESWCNLYFSRQLDMTLLVCWNHALEISCHFFKIQGIWGKRNPQRN